MNINNPPRLGAGNTDWRIRRAGGFGNNIAATQLQKNTKKTLKVFRSPRGAAGRAGSAGPGRAGPGRPDRAIYHFEGPNWSTQNGRLLWGSVPKFVRKVAPELVPIILGEVRRSLRSLCFLPRRFEPRGAARRFANLINT